MAEVPHGPRQRLEIPNPSSEVPPTLNAWCLNCGQPGPHSIRECRPFPTFSTFATPTDDCDPDLQDRVDKLEKVLSVILIRMEKMEDYIFQLQTSGIFQRVRNLETYLDNSKKRP